MTCAACSAAVQRALAQAARRARGERQPDAQERHRGVRSRRPSRPSAWSTWCAKTGYEAHLPLDGRGRVRRAGGARPRRRRGVPRPAAQGRRRLARPAPSRWSLSMPLMTGGVHDGHHAVSADPFMRWVMDALDAADAERRCRGCSRSTPACCRSCCWSLTLGVMAWAGPALLHAGVGGAAARHREHEHAGVDRARSRPSSTPRRPPSRPTCSCATASRPTCYYEAVVFIIALVLAGNTHGGARQAAHRRGAARRWRRCSRARRASWPRTASATCPSRTCAAATRSLVRPGRARARRRRDRRRRERGRRVDAHRRADAGARRPRATGSSAAR